jgi:hypothetical protein
MSSPKAKGRACAAKTRGGGVCRKEAGWGTDHIGFGRCKLHGGMAPSGRVAAKRQAAAEAVVTYGLPRDIDAWTALEEELCRTAGHVAWLSGLVADLEQRDLKQYQHTDAGGTIERPAIWVELYQRERTHLTNVAKTCVSLGMDERRVQLAEDQGQLIAGVLRGVLTELGVIDHPEAPAIVRRHLTLIAGQRA